MICMIYVDIMIKTLGDICMQIIVYDKPVSYTCEMIVSSHIGVLGNRVMRNDPKSQSYFVYTVVNTVALL